MTGKRKIYLGISCAAWACVFQYFNLSIGTINLLPVFAAYILYWKAIRYLGDEKRDYKLLKPLAITLLIWHLIGWMGDCIGTNFLNHFTVVSIIITLIDLYFHFQFMTDCAEIARQYQEDSQELDRRIIKWRTVQVVMTTLILFPGWTWYQDREWVQYGLLLMMLAGVIAGIGIMAALFALRKLFVETDEDF